MRFLATGKLSDGRVFSGEFFADDIIDAHAAASDALVKEIRARKDSGITFTAFNVTPAKEEGDGQSEMFGPYRVNKPRERKPRARKTTDAQATTDGGGDPAQQTLPGTDEQEQQQDATPARGGRRRGGSSR